MFAEGTFVPTAKITEKEELSIVTNYLGTPEAMYNGEGESVWSCELNSYGSVRNFKGNWKGDCPFRYQGQYEDCETGLYYNRFRYYSPEEGIYISQDPIGLNGGTYNVYSYVFDPNYIYDLFGLDWNYRLRNSEGKVYYHGRASDNETMADVTRRHNKTVGTEDGKRFGDGDVLEQITARGTSYNTVRGIEERGIEENPLLGRQKKKVRGNKIAGISAKKKITKEGIERLKEADKLLNGIKASQMPTIASLNYNDGCPK